MLRHVLTVFLVSMVPLIELRGAIPYGVLYGLPLWMTFAVANVGNMLPVPLIYFLARRVRKAEGKGGAGPFLGAAAVCGHPSAGNRRVDGNAGRQPSEYGL